MISLRTSKNTTRNMREHNRLRWREWKKSASLLCCACMTNLRDLAQQHGNLPENEQKKAGQAIAGAMSDEHRTFLKEIIRLLDAGEIVATDPQSFLKRDVYDRLSEQEQDRVDRSLLNIADQVRHIEAFYRSAATPDESPHLETMIAHLWQMTRRMEEKADVLKI